MKVLVYDIEPGGMSDRQADLFEAALRSEIGKLEGVELVTHPPEEAGGPGCVEQTQSCLARLASALGADVVVVGQTARMGASRVLTLKRMRIQDGAIEGS